MRLNVFGDVMGEEEVGENWLWGGVINLILVMVDIFFGCVVRDWFFRLFWGCRYIVKCGKEFLCGELEWCCNVDLLFVYWGVMRLWVWLCGSL